MKRISVALASVLAVLLAGSASARVPETREAKSGPGSGLASTGSVQPAAGLAKGAPDAPGLPRVEPPGALGDLAGFGLGALPGVVVELLQALPFGDTDVAGTGAGATGAAGTGAAETAENPLGTETPTLVTPPDLLPGSEPAQPSSPEPKAKQAAKRVKASLPGKPGLAQVSSSTAAFPGLPASGHAGYSTGTVIHADTLTSGTTQLTDTEVAFSGATFTSAPLTGAISNEVDRVVAPTLEVAGSAYGRGSGLEIGLAQGPGTENQIILANKAEAKAPPSTALISNEVGPIDASPVAVASLLRGQAQSRAAAACTTGIDLSYGQGYAANVGLLSDTVQTINEDPLRSVSQSTSRTRLVPQEGSTGPIAKFGLMSETRQTIAPVTLLGGALKLEFAGEWVLRAVADGKQGSVHYGPGDVEPETPVLTIIGGPSPIQVLAQDLLGNEGLAIEVPGIATVVIGEDARAIDGDANSQPIETATFAAGAVDVVRVIVADGSVADLRVGHMEAAVAVPAGGIECGIGLVKVANPESVRAGQQFVWTVTVSNPNDCILTNLKVVDNITTTAGIKYSIISSEPPADLSSATNLVWNDIGPLNPGQKKDLLIRVQTAPDSAGGRFTDEAIATGVCGPAAGEAGAEAAQGVNLSSRVVLNLPDVAAVLGEPLRGLLPRTGGLLSAFPALALTALGFGLHNVLRRRRTTDTD